ncbi:MAG: DUF1254 domain-containing protein [Rhizobiaceae bacterium]|nr:DUF1254 domain-containing protein [Rhizobiaceae bacterium]MBO6725762.1 DUF1254 domain-containing protein [Rhizobiaceae bacterium]
MTRLAYTAILSLFGAGIVHIAVLMLLPHYTERDAWSQLSKTTDYYAMTRIGGSGATTPLVRSVDPLFAAIACRFDLDDGVVHVAGEGAVPFWSMSVYDRNGQNIYSFNDRTAPDGLVDFVVLTPIQTIEVRKTLPESFVDAVFVEADLSEGIVVVRAFVPDPTWRASIDEFLAGIRCETA